MPAPKTQAERLAVVAKHARILADLEANRRRGTAPKSSVDIEAEFWESSGVNAMFRELEAEAAQREADAAKLMDRASAAVSTGLLRLGR